MDQKKIGKFIAKLRKKKNMTQEQFAEKLGVSNKTVSRWENGTNMPDYSVLKDVCEELDININELMSGEKIEKENYMPKAEENFINLKKKLDRVTKLFNMLDKIILIIGIGSIILFMFFKFLYHVTFNPTCILDVARRIILISILLRYTLVRFIMDI